MNPPGAHIGGIPIEETLGSFGPPLLIAVGAAMATLRARLRHARSRRGTREARRPGAAEGRLQEPALDAKNCPALRELRRLEACQPSYSGADELVPNFVPDSASLTP